MKRHRVFINPMAPRFHANLPLMSEVFSHLRDAVGQLTMVFSDMVGGSTCVDKSPIANHLNHVDNRYSGKRVSEGTSALLSDGPDVVKNRQCHIQGRSLSECSVDSEDSFIVFHGSPGALEYGWTNDEAECHDLSESSSDEEDVCVVQGSDGESNGYDSETEDEVDEDTINDTCDGFSQRMEEVNQRWHLQNQTCPLPKQQSEVRRKQVCFAPSESLLTVHPIVAWDFAYRASRVGPWEEMARDRARFRTRIARMEDILAPVLTSAHRKSVLARREELAPIV